MAMFVASALLRHGLLVTHADWPDASGKEKEANRVRA